MTDALAVISPKTLAEAKDLASTLSQARSIPEALQKSPADVLAIVMAGAELGLAPMQSIRALVLIKGKPTLSADAMGALVKSSPLCVYLQCTESTAKVATFKTQRKGDPEPTTLSFTIDEANAAGLTGDNWKRFPKAMLRARAQSALCRMVYQDLLLGVYDSEELDAPGERDVTPARPVAATSAPDGVEAMKRRMKIVDATGADVRAMTGEDPATLGWGSKAAMRLDAMTSEQLQKAIDDAKAKATANEGDERELWAGRAARYQAALESRASAEVAS